jgi:D-serine deaminase-like pyridoxal phosphate-dependent protein
MKQVADLDTPCLLVELAALERNLARMAVFFRERHAKIRPHFKTNKCTRIALRQLAAGSCSGITCAVVSEAEILAAAGVKDILIANQVLGEGKLRRLAELRRKVEVRCCVDDAGQLAPLAAAARAAGVEIGVLVEVDVGMSRAGLASPEEAAGLAGLVGRTPGLRFAGLQAYEGQASFVADPAERSRLASEAVGKIQAARRAVEAAGLEVGLVSAGSTGTYDIIGLADGVDELQVGSYALMDARYRRVRLEFESALFLLSTAVSVRGDRVVFDTGYKSCGAELAPPEIVGLAEQPQTYKLNEEHFRVSGVAGRFKVGQKVRMVPWHGCTSCNLHPEFHVVEGERALDSWPIEAAGCRL